jgi:hypothetical protein
VQQSFSCGYAGTTSQDMIRVDVQVLYSNRGLAYLEFFFLVFPQLVDRLLSFKLVSAASTRASISSLILFRMAVEPPQPKNVYLNSY